MKTWMLSVAILFSVTAFGEGRPADHGDPASLSTPPPPTADRAAPQNRDVKLYQMISACLADRPGNGKAQEDQIKRLLQK